MHKAKERLAKMERRHLIAACIVVVTLATAIVAITVILMARDPKQPSQVTPQFSVSGEIVCLPHKDREGPQTLECAYGLRADDNRHYGLQIEPFPYDTKVGARVTVKGTLTTGNEGIYDIVGTIKADTFTER
jgi:hypothetical protein